MESSAGFARNSALRYRGGATLTLRCVPRYVCGMRFLLLLLCVGLSGCTKVVPAKKPPVVVAPKVPALNVSSLGTPSGLIDERAGDPDKLPFDLPLGKGYGIEGAWAGPNQVKGTYQFERIGNFTVKKSDNNDVDPKEIAALLDKWILASGAQSTQGSGAGSLQRTLDYGTAQTLGMLSYTVRPDAPAKEVTFRIDVREQPRQSR